LVEAFSSITILASSRNGLGNEVKEQKTKR
jgi:hypothetical protein